jgi:hypothetical protein
MYRAYDRHLYERPTDTPATVEIDPLDREHLDHRVVVHPLLLCPPVAHGVRYILVRRDWPGARSVLDVGCAKSVHESINLAEVRWRAARLGANEVHLLPAPCSLGLIHEQSSAAVVGQTVPERQPFSGQPKFLATLL